MTLVLSMSSIRVVIADGDPLAAEGVAERVRSLDGLNVVGIVRNGKELLEGLVGFDPGLVVMEVAMPGMDGIDTMRAIRRMRPDLPVLAYSTLCNIEYINSMRTEGAAGYLLKHGPADELGRAISTILSGREYLSEEAAREVEQGYRFTSKQLGGEYIGLTEREREVIRLIALERTNKEIADELCVSIDTVKTHRKHLMAKLNVRSIAGLVRYAVERRWV